MGVTADSRFTRDVNNAKLAINTKEDFEVLGELFAGNHLFMSDRVSEEIKLLKMIDVL